MPEKRTIKKAREDKRAGKSASTQAGEFVREQIHKIRRGVHGARSAKQAIAIGLSEARRSGVDLKPPAKGKTKPATRKSAKYAYEAGQRELKTGKRKTTRRPRVSRAVSKVLKGESRSSASHSALSRQAKSAARGRSAASRSAAAKKAARTKGAAGRSAAAKKGPRTRARRQS
jgi:hypothetical protein